MLAVFIVAGVDRSLLPLGRVCLLPEGFLVGGMMSSWVEAFAEESRQLRCLSEGQFVRMGVQD